MCLIIKSCRRSCELFNLEFRSDIFNHPVRCTIAISRRFCILILSATCMYVHTLQLLWYRLRSSLFNYLANVTWGRLRHEGWCNKAASQRASMLCVIGHGHVAYAPYIDQIPCYTTCRLKSGIYPLPINGACAT